MTGSGDKKATLYEVIYERWEWVVWIYTHTGLKINKQNKTFSAYYQSISFLLLYNSVCVDLRYILFFLFAFICASIQWVCLLSRRGSDISNFVTNLRHYYILYIYACVSIFAYLAVFVYRNFLHMFVLCMCISLLFLFLVFVCLRHMKFEKNNLTRIIMFVFFFSLFFFVFVIYLYIKRKKYLIWPNIKIYERIIVMRSG